MDPANRSVGIHDRGAGQLRSVGKFRRTPILRESRRFVFGTPLLQRRIGEQLEKVVVIQSHRAIGSLVFIADADRSSALERTKLLSFSLRADRDETNVQSTFRMLLVELAQLRERFLKERSTNVPEPHDQRGLRDTQRRNRRRKCVADLGN
jgi:hypothetical protein